jgi:hypothetical protein
MEFPIPFYGSANPFDFGPTGAGQSPDAPPVTVDNSPPGGAVDVGTPNGMGTEAGFLTPDALLAYCESRLSGLDSQMRDFFNKQETANRQQAQLNQLASLYNQHSGGINMKDGNGNATSAAMDDATFQKQLVEPLQNMIDSLPDSDPLKAKLTSTLKTLTTDGGTGKDTIVSAQDITNIETDLKNDVSDLSAGAELNMIQLQSIMSQRQTAIQLTTNLVQSLGDQTNKIADNIGK